MRISRSIHVAALPNFKLSCLFIVEFKSSLYILIHVPYQIYDLHIFSPILWGFFHFLYCVLQSTKVFNFDNVQFIYFFSFIAYALGVISKKPLPNPRS